MSSPEVIDIESLVTAFSEDHPSGVELRQSDHASLYHDLRGAFEKSVRAERDLVQAQSFPDEDSSEIEDPQWGEVRTLAIEVLQNHSKDLAVASWLTESLFRLKGFPGLRDGIRVCLEISKRYWSVIHPEPDEDYGYEDTVAQLDGLAAERSFGPIELIPVTREHDGFSIFDFNEANRIEAMEHKEKQHRIENGEIDRARFDESFVQTGREALETTIDDIGQCIDDLKELGDFLDENCTNNSFGDPTSPSLTSFRKKLEEIRGTIQNLLNELLPNDESTASETTSEESLNDGSTGEMTQAVRVSAPGEITNRKDAVKVLKKVAEFFRKTEPHSPVSYSLEQVAKWADLSLPELLKDLIHDDSVLSELQRRAGIPLDDSSSEND
ncbi:MAG: type VI secretion system protein TssA [Blastopirellula sp.]|nr:MAG: type VI secretion system protein TssA [Blastopirellula sp.]